MPSSRFPHTAHRRPGRRTAARTGSTPSDVLIERVEGRILMSGTYDPSWNNGGQLSIVAPGGGTARTATVITQPDERTILAGTFTTTGGTTETVLTRRTAQGNLDTSFNGGNDVIINFIESGITLEPDGKILVAGPDLERLNQDGTVDTTFGTNGRITLNVPQGNVAVQADGKILVSGTTSGGTPEITRYNANGSVDTTYGDANGTKVISILGGGNAVYSAGADGLTSTGEAIVAFAVNGNPSLATFGVVKLTTAGQFDTSFGLNGVSETAGYSEPANIGGLVLDTAGTIYTVGNYDEGTSTSTGYLLAYSADGSHANISPPGGLDTIASTVVLGADNKPVIIGTAVQGSGATKHTVIAVNRFNAVNPLAPVWVPDPTWGGAGLVTIFYNGPSSLDSTSVGDLGGAVAELADGNIVLAGVSANPGTPTTSFNLTRLLGDASIAASIGTVTGLTYFDTNGSGTFTPGEAGLPGYGVFIDANGNGALDPNEVQVFTDENGNYTFNGLAAGTYTIVQILPSGFTHTQPSAGVSASYTITVAADQTIVGKDFGIT
jgi:uncharacterized delta-60 repeat protein